MSILGESQIKVGANMSTFDSDVTSGINKTSSKMSGLGGTIAKGLAVGTVAIAGLGAAALANTTRVGEMADSLFDLSAVTGASTDQLQEWRFVAEKTGQKTDFFGDSVKQLNRTMTQLENGTGKGSVALDRLGVSTRDSAGNMKSSAQITNDAIIALSGMTDVSLRAQLATDIFSRKANELIPVLDEGAAGLEAMKLQAYDLGGVLSEDSLRAADSFRASLAVLHTQIAGVGNAVGANLAPVLDSAVQFISNSVLPIIINVSDAFGTWWTKMQDGPGIMANIKDSLGNLFSGDTITKVMSGIQGAIQTGVEGAAAWINSGGLASLVESFLSGKASFLKAGLDLIIALIGGIAQMLPTVIQFIASDLLPAIVNTITTAIPLLLNAAVQLFTALLTAAVTIVPTLLTTVVGIIPMLVDAIVGLVPLLVTTGIELIVALVVGITDVLPDLIDAGITAVLALVDGVLEALPALIDAVVEAIPKLITAIVGMLPRLIDGGIRLVLGLLDGIVKALPKIITAVVGAIPMIITSLIATIPQLIGAAIKLVLGLVTGIIGAIPQLVMAVIQAIPQIIMALIGMIPQLLGAGRDMIVGLWNGLVEAWPAIQAWFQALPGVVIGFLLTARTWLLEKGKDIIGGIIGGIVEKNLELIQWFKDLPGKVLDLVTDARTWLVDAGKNIISGLWDGLKSKFEEVKTWVGGIGSWISDHKGPEEYDKRLLVPAGGWIMSGLGEGMLAGIPALRRALSDVSDAIQFSPNVPAIQTSTGQAGASGQGFSIGQVSVVVNVSGVASDYDAERAGRMAAQAALKELSEKARLR